LNDSYVKQWVQTRLRWIQTTQVLAQPVRPPVIEETQTMKTLTQISRAALTALVLAAAGNAMAANAPATVSVDAAYLTANDLAVAGVGGSTYTTSGNIGTVSLAIDTIPSMLIDFLDAAGFSITASTFLGDGVATFSNFKFDASTGIMSGNLVGGGLLSKLNYLNGDLLKANTLTGVGTSLITASNFTLADGLSSYLTTNKISPALLPVSSVVKTVALPVPEPTTYALMGLGLVGIALVARKRQA
jgi:PEP-CTERM motif